MRKNISYNIVKKVRVENSPFKIAIYIYKDQNKILVENLETGRCVEADSYTVNSYLKIQDIETAWKRSFDHSYVRYSRNNPEYFMPLYQEANRFATLRFKIVSRCAPQFRTKRVQHPGDPHRTLQQVDNAEVESTVSPLKPYNILYKNIKDFEIENFKLEMIDDDYYSICDENFEKLKTPYIECRVPLFQIYTTLSPKIDLIRYYGRDHFNYEQSLTVTKIEDKFYRFPYGNTRDVDTICLGGQNLGQYKQPDSIQEVAYLYMVATHYNGDFTPHLKFNNDIPTTLDIDWLREKVNKNEFDISFVDALFYLSQCETVEEVNLNIFILTPNIPEEILDFEKKLFDLYNEEEPPSAFSSSSTLNNTAWAVGTTATTADNNTNYANFTNVTEYQGQILVDDPPPADFINNRFVVGNIIPPENLNMEEDLTVNDHDREILGQIATSLEEQQATVVEINPEDLDPQTTESVSQILRELRTGYITPQPNLVRPVRENQWDRLTTEFQNTNNTGGANDTDRESTGQN